MANDIFGIIGSTEKPVQEKDEMSVGGGRLKGKQIGLTVSVVPSNPGIETRMGKLEKEIENDPGGEIAPQM